MDIEGVKQATPLSDLGSWHKYVYTVFVSNDESHYAVWTVWISIVVRVRVRVDFILQNMAPPYLCQEQFILS